MLSVKRAASSIDGMSAAGASCTQRTATRQCKDKQRLRWVLGSYNSPRMMLAWCCSTMAVQQAGVCNDVCPLYEIQSSTMAPC